MIRRFRVQNYKALRDVTLELTPIHVLIGPNDAGKTSCLEALAALSVSGLRDISEALPPMWSGADLVWQKNDSLKVSFSADVLTDDATFACSIEFYFKPHGRRVYAISDNGTDSSPVLHWHRTGGQNAAAHGNEVALTASAINAQQSAKEWDLFRGAVGGYQRCRWYPPHLAVPAATDAQPRFELFPSGFGLVQCLDDILGEDRKRFTELEKRFCKSFPEMASIKLVKSPAFRGILDQFGQLSFQGAPGKGLHFKLRSGSEIAATQVSDGVLLVLAYLTILYGPDPPRLLLVEEPENGVHPQRLKQILELLRELIASQGHTQVVMTTHSPYALDHFKPEEVTMLRKDDDGAVSAHPLSKSRAVKSQIDIFTLGEIWTAEGEEKLAETAEPSEAAPKG